MKLGCAVSTYPTKFGPIIFKDGNLTENAKIMKRYSYEGVDLFIKQTSPDQIRAYRRLFGDYGINITTLFAIYLGENGVKLSERDEKLRRKYVDMVKAQLENACEAGAVGLGMGFIRGGYEDDETEDDALKRIAEALEGLGEYAESIGTSILLEPVNRYEINTLNSAKQTADFIRDHHLKGVLMQPDMFHMNIEDRSIPEAIRYMGNMIGNLHISSSNRYAVGNGHFDFAQVFEALRDVSYDGCLTLEAFAPNPEQALKQTREYLEPYL